ncbi:hypothetical protein NKH91_20355 [Mesorhizobium sp. M0894]|uniref:hypothetical protein n=1 Tax=unclassified Mesorhizobium TaxID=325217 RepID=UPI00333C5E02
MPAPPLTCLPASSPRKTGRGKQLQPRRILFPDLVLPLIRGQRYLPYQGGRAMRAIATSRPVILRLVILLLACLFAMEPANSKDSDVFLCTVSDFRTWSDIPSSGSPEFVANNKARKFDIQEFADHFIVTSKSSTFKPSSTKYDIFQRSVYQVAAFDSTTFMLDTFVMRTADIEGPPTKARVTLQTPTYLNTWYLDCALQN